MNLLRRPINAAAWGGVERQIGAAEPVLTRKRFHSEDLVLAGTEIQVVLYPIHRQFRVTKDEMGRILKDPIYVIEPFQALRPVIEIPYC